MFQNLKGSAITYTLVIVKMIYICTCNVIYCNAYIVTHFKNLTCINRQTYTSIIIKQLNRNTISQS